MLQFFGSVHFDWNIRAIIRFYESERQRLHDHNTVGRRPTPAEVTRFVNNDSTKISWTRAPEERFGKKQRIEYSRRADYVVAQYRPFTRKHMFFSRRLNEMIYQIPTDSFHMRRQRTSVDLCDRDWELLGHFLCFDD